LTNPVPYPLAEATLVDKAIAALNERLAGLPWLTKAYGQAQRLVGEGQLNYPAVFTAGQGSGDYLSLLPDRHLASLGGYSFWDTKEPVTVSNWRNDLASLQFKAGLVVWFDFRKVYPADWKGRTIWNVIQDVLNELKSGGGMATFGEDLEFHYSGETIFPRYSHKEIDRQFLMKPYGGFRIDGTVHFTDNCP